MKCSTCDSEILPGTPWYEGLASADAAAAVLCEPPAEANPRFEQLADGSVLFVMCADCATQTEGLVSMLTPVNSGATALRERSMKVGDPTLVPNISDDELVKLLRIDNLGRSDITTILILEYQRRQSAANSQELIAISQEMLAQSDENTRVARHMVGLTWVIAGMTLLNVLLVSLSLFGPLW